MKRNKFNPSVISILMAAVLFCSVMTVFAYKYVAAAEGDLYQTDKTDRTLIKEMYFDQKEIIRLLNELKSDVKGLKSK